jgi:hypothetical protein
MFANLCSNIQERLLPEAFVNVDLSLPFPGKASISADPEQKRTSQLHLSTAGWFSTGFWLQAGQSSHISLNEPHSDLMIQIGAHSEVLFDEKGPWQRLPAVTVSFRLEQSMFLCSPYGGILYILHSSFFK